MHIDTMQSRRAFLRRTSQLGMLGAAAPLASSLGLLSEAAAAANPADYKALVCVFLLGGNDHANTLPPYDADNHAAYRAARPRLALAHGKLTPTALRPANDLEGRQFALHPSLAPLLPMFNAGTMAPVLNMGALVQPTSKAAYFNKSVRLPPKLFSHNDQQSYVQALKPEGAPMGWGGRMGDLVQSANDQSALTCVALNGNTVFLSGQNVAPYAVTTTGVTELIFGYGQRAEYAPLRQLMTMDNGSWIAAEHARRCKRALDLSDTVGAALKRAPASNYAGFFPGGNNLAEQLQMVARLATLAPSMGVKRQIFFLSVGNYDMHTNLHDSHPRTLAGLANALRGFDNAMKHFGLAQNVTTFTASDFGRTLSENGDGSDHGWGSHQFVMGGAVNGGKIYGTPPAVGLNTPDDVGQGRLIPTISIDQFAATLALWFGVPAGVLPQILPNLANFDQSSWNLGFV